ncbi:MAG: ferritin-like domain-containing protein [Anaerolineae bacterium]
MNAISRRNLLKGSAVLGGGTLLSFSQLFGIARVFGQDMAADDDLQTIINLASTAELFATTHYLAAINAAADLGLDDAQVAYMKAGFLAEQDHLELLKSLGAQPVVTEFYVPGNLFSDIGVFTATTEVAETAFTSAYLAAVRIFSKSADTTPYAVTCAQIAAVEQTHLALIRQIGKKLANNTRMPSTRSTTCPAPSPCSSRSSTAQATALSVRSPRRATATLPPSAPTPICSATTTPACRSRR